MKWEELTPKTLEYMKILGNYTPTTNNDCIKGYIGEDQEGQDYLSSDCLRERSAAFNEVADWLDKQKQTGEA